MIWTLHERRAFPRRPLRRSAQVTCVKGGMGAGKNVALGAVNVSQSGVGLVVSEPLPPRQPVEVSLTTVTHRRPVKRLAEVVWSEPMVEGMYLVGVSFAKRLPYAELQDLT